MFSGSFKDKFTYSQSDQSFTEAQRKLEFAFAFPGSQSEETTLAEFREKEQWLGIEGVIMGTVEPFAALLSLLDESAKDLGIAPAVARVPAEEKQGYLAKAFLSSPLTQSERLLVYNRLNSKGHSALLLACAATCVNVALFLIDQGVQLVKRYDHDDGHDMTELRQAIFNRSKRLAFTIISSYSKAQITLNGLDAPAAYAAGCNHGPILQFLLEHGFLATEYFNLNDENDLDENKLLAKDALFSAVLNGATEAFDILVGSHLTIKIAAHLRPPLDYCAINGESLLNFSILLEAEAFLNSNANKCNFSIKLLEAGANPYFKDSEGVDGLTQARKYKSKKVLDYLAARQARSMSPIIYGIKSSDADRPGDANSAEAGSEEQAETRAGLFNKARIF